MNNKFFDYLFPVGGGAGGGVFGMITFGEMTNIAISAAIFAIVGGIIGWGIKLLLDNIYKKFKKNV